MTLRPMSLLLLSALFMAGCGAKQGPTQGQAGPLMAPMPAAAQAQSSVRALEAPLGSKASVSLVASSSTLSEAPAAVLSAGGAAWGAQPEGLGLVGGPEAQPTGLAASQAQSQQLSALAMGPDDPADLQLQAVETPPPNFFVTDRTPYGVVVVSRSAHSATIAWRTEAPTTGVIEYGRAWGFDKKGFTHELRDEVLKTDHKLTITDLRRWTGYKFRITGHSALGLAFPELTRAFRTKFWAWR